MTAGRSLDQVNFLQFISMTTGGQTAVPSLLTLGMRPYMTMMIIWQVITALDLDVVKQLSQRRVGIIQRFLTLFFSLIQGFEMIYFIRDAFDSNDPWQIGINLNVAIAWIVLVGGAMFMTWLGDLNAVHGIGGTIALIIPGIIASIPTGLSSGVGSAITTSYSLTTQHIIIAVLIGLLFIIVMYYLYQGELHLHVERPLTPSVYASSYFPHAFLNGWGDAVHVLKLLVQCAALIGQSDGRSNRCVSTLGGDLVLIPNLAGHSDVRDFDCATGVCIRLPQCTADQCG